jgi:hypothetical protein
LRSCAFSAASRLTTSLLVTTTRLCAWPAPGDLQGLPPLVVQRGRDERWHGQSRGVEDAAVGEQALDPPAQLLVEHPQAYAQIRVQVMGGKGGVQVTDVVVLGDDQRGRVGDAGGAQHRLLAVAALDEGHAESAGAGAEVLGRRSRPRLRALRHEAWWGVLPAVR